MAAATADAIVLRGRAAQAARTLGRRNGRTAPVVAMLDDRARSGRPRIHGLADRVKIVAAVTEELPETDSRWSHTLLAQHLHLEVGISAAQIGRILADLELKPHRVRG